MATFTAIRNKKQGRAATLGTLKYITRQDKIRHGNALLATGLNCTAATSYTEMMLTKEQNKKDNGRYFYQFVQSFSADEVLAPEQAHEIGMEFAAKQFPDYEVVVATHCDTNNLHNHFLVNSVSYKTGMKLHQCHDDLLVHRQVNDEICMAHGLTVLEPYRKGQQVKGMKPGEYRAAERGESWKFALMNAIDDALRYSTDKQSFIENMEYEGYKVSWSDTRKAITYTCPNGMKCRDYRLHDETYLKDNMEKLFEYRATHGFIPQTPEPPEGWLGQLYPTKPPKKVVAEVVELGKEVESISNTTPPPIPYIHTDSKQRQRENRKKLAQGHQLQSEQEQEFTQTM